MGDAADYFDEAGQEGWWAHQRGECEFGCQYCCDEDEMDLEEGAKEFFDSAEEGEV